MIDDSGRGGTAALLVAALIAVPFLCGALVFVATAPAMVPGVYVEVVRGRITDVYPLSGYDAGRPDAGAEASAHALVLPDGDLSAFLVVQPPGVPPAGTDGQTITLFAFTVDSADPRLGGDAVRLPAEIRRVNRRIVRLTSGELTGEWNERHLAFQQYHRVLAQSSKPRSTLAVLIGLELDDLIGGRRMYAVRVGPPLTLEGPR